jgi:hypothetical protein
MTSYTPLFGSLSTGTLCGKWPDIGLWPIVLSLADRHGVVDVTPAYIAGITGLPIDEVVTCMKRFGEPDPYSRSSDQGGARLVLIDPENRNWGWRVVNHSKYAERARKRAYDAARTESGRDAERKREVRKPSRDVPTSPDVSRAVPLSTQLNSSDKEGALPRRRAKPKKEKPRGRPRPHDFTLTDKRRARILSKLPDADPEAIFEAFAAHHDAKESKFANWDRGLDKWLGNAPEFGYRRQSSEAAETSTSEEAPRGRAASGLPYAN